ncbi:MAG: 50S ribosomal protein L29 [Bacteroidales bacterium]|nr:50S ribosomal protein L29 [Bacteroidales bacterium]
MKQEEIREMSTADLKERLEETRMQYIKMKMNHAVSPLENPSKLTATRKTIARMMTELTKRQNAEQKNK